MFLLKLLEKQQQCQDFLADFLIDVQYRLSKQNILSYALFQHPAPLIDVCPCSDASLASMILDPSWLARVHQGQQSDVSFDPFQRE